MCGIIIVVLIVLIVCTIQEKLSTVSPGRSDTIIDVPMDSFKDIKGNNIKGAGLTRLTTPGMRSCPQLLMPHSQETSLLQPGNP